MDLTASFDWSRLLLPHGLAVAVALVLDRFAVELPTRWHPVAWMGRYLGAMGGLIAPRSREPSPNWTAFAAGALAWYGGAMAIVLLAWSLQWWLVRQDPVLAGVVLGLGLKTMLSWRRPRDDVAGV
jgi:adenosylcobinamide-phosphate synthase